MGELNKEITASEAAAGENISFSKQWDAMFTGNEDMKFMTPSLGSIFDKPLQTRDSFFSLMNEWQLPVDFFLG